MDLLDRLLGHDRWATERLLARCASLSDEQLDARFDIGLGSVRATFVHMIANSEAWTAAMKETPYAWPTESAGVASLIGWYAAAHESFASFARDCVASGRLDEAFTDHWGEQMTFSGAILHVVLHNEGHRNEIVHMLLRLGCGEIEVDHALWDHVSRGAVID